MHIVDQNVSMLNPVMQLNVPQFRCVLADTPMQYAQYLAICIEIHAIYLLNTMKSRTL